ncbi:anthocyanidin 3-O-glucosyltransferase 6-like [Euphorbia lathyris]|uniref:anthocyanidin 3-O-glucosyltransferase 6-like n=1 Tax=Euphorbia lathyris TaxID=212925 RepID=UPI0033134AFF
MANEIKFPKSNNKMKAELILIPSPGVGHLVPAVELAKLIVNRREQVSVTILAMKPSIFDAKITNYISSVSSSLPETIRLINLPSDEQKNTRFSLVSFIETQKPHVKQAVSHLITQSESPPQLAAFVVGMFCTTMIDVATEFGVDSYIFFPSSAASLGFMLFMQSLNDEQHVDTTEFKDSDTELTVPSFINSVPAKVFPSVVFNKDFHPIYYGNAKRFKEVKGILVNTSLELEPYAVSSFTDSIVPTPPIYPVGPILNLKMDGGDSETSGTQKKDEIMTWLDEQPPLSVVFLCFGSMGSFGEEQVKEIAYALEHSGYRFLWSLRQPPPKGKMGIPTDYTNLADILSQGFLDRTADIGRIIGWAPQVAILAHPAIGGFVSHCGWNSILESIWYGVPIATWPLFSEQQLNAFELIIELGLAVEIKMDYRKDYGSDYVVIVSASDIERGIRCVMEHDSIVRKKVQEISEKSRKALMDDGSSISFLDRLISEMMENIK